jgi:protein-L-isoaspartate(D-aspartate) O-methyltransferase
MTPAESRVRRLLSELRRQGVGDARVLAAIERIPRHLFVAPPFLDQAYENIALPIGRGQTVSQPVVVGLMTQALAAGSIRNWCGSPKVPPGSTSIPF